VIRVLRRPTVERVIRNALLCGSKSNGVINLGNPRERHHAPHLVEELLTLIELSPKPLPRRFERRIRRLVLAIREES
jgi:hypothetical protein